MASGQAPPHSGLVLPPVEQAFPELAWGCPAVEGGGPGAPRAVLLLVGPALQAWLPGSAGCRRAGSGRGRRGGEEAPPRATIRLTRVHPDSQLWPGLLLRFTPPEQPEELPSPLGHTLCWTQDLRGSPGAGHPFPRHFPCCRCHQAPVTPARGKPPLVQVSTRQAHPSGPGLCPLVPLSGMPC